MTIRRYLKWIGTNALWLIGVLIFLPIHPVLADEEDSNPYEGIRLSRLGYISGEVLLQRGDDEEWVPSSVNMPLRPHDKLWSTDGARTELQFDDGSIVRLAENTNVDLLSLERGTTQLQLTLGVATFVTRFTPGMTVGGAYFEIDTPQAAIVVNRPANFRVEVTEDGSTEIAVREGEIKLSTDDEPVIVTKNQRIVIDSNENPRYYLESVKPRDEWDDWNEDRDRQIAQVTSRPYLPPGYLMGVTELDVYGSWSQVPTYGWVWAPQVPIDWVPYRTGRWIWIEPWGWTWVSYEPWGWVPYHYGRWAMVSGRWCWVPGPRREVWSPGHVRFIRGRDWVAWVPLAPGEVYYYRPGMTTPFNRNMINYHVRGAVTILPEKTFISGAPLTGRFIPPADPVRAGRVIAGPPPVIPTEASLRPRPQDEVRTGHLPPRVVQRPVIYDHPTPSPPLRFQNRIQELREKVQQGEPPIGVRPRVEENRVPGVEEKRDRERIHKDIIVRKSIREPVREAPRSIPPPRREEFRPPAKRIEPRKESPGRSVEGKPLYRKPPQPARQREVR